MIDRLSLIVQVCGTGVSKILIFDNTDNNIENIRFGTTCTSIRYSIICFLRSCAFFIKFVACTCLV